MRVTLQVELEIFYDPENGINDKYPLRLFQNDPNIVVITSVTTSNMSPSEKDMAKSLSLYYASLAMGRSV